MNRPPLKTMVMITFFLGMMTQPLFSQGPPGFVPEAEHGNNEASAAGGQQGESVETQYVDAQSVDAQCVETQYVDAQSVDAQGAPEQSAEAQRAEAQRAEAQRAEAQKFASALTAGPEIKAALHRYEQAASAVTAAGYKGDVLLSLDPAWRVSWDNDTGEGPFNRASISLGLSIPMGLTSADKIRLDKAVGRLQAAEAELNKTIITAAAGLLRGYSRTYLAIREIEVLTQELEATRLFLSAQEERYTRGDVSLLELFNARDEFHRQERDLEDGITRAELAHVDLMLQTGGEIDHQSIRDRNVEKIAGLLQLPFFLFREIEFPALEEALSRMHETHPDIIQQTIQIKTAAADALPIDELVFSSLRISAQSHDHTASVNYSFSGRTLSLGYTPPAIDIGGSVSSGADSGSEGSSGGGFGSLSSITVSAGISFNKGQEQDLSVSTAAAEALYEQNRLEIITRRVEADILSQYRNVEAARAALVLAERAKERTEATLQAVEAREALGLTTPADKKAAEAALLRSELQKEKAQHDLIYAGMVYAAAGYLPEALPEILLETLSQTLFQSNSGTIFETVRPYPSGMRTDY